MSSVTLDQIPDGVTNEPRRPDEGKRDGVHDPSAAIFPMRSLRRTGQRPLPFDGATIATVCGVTPALPFWYEINVHRTVADNYLTDIRLFQKSADLTDLFRVTDHDDLDALIEHLERYDPAGDVTPSQELTHATSTAEMALSVARLQLHVDQITQHFRAMVGELLAKLLPRE